MKRLIDGELVKWASEQTPKPLLLRGARQVGKTYAVHKLARHFRHFAEVNLDETPEAAAFFDGPLSAQPIAEKHIDTGVRVSLENFAALPDVRILPLYAIHRITDGNLIQ